MIRVAMPRLLLVAVLGIGQNIRAQVIYEKPVPEGDPARYRVEVNPCRIFDTVTIDFLKKSEDVVRLEIKDRVLYATILHDLKAEAEEAEKKAALEKWSEGFGQRYMRLMTVNEFQRKRTAGPCLEGGGETAFDFTGPEIGHGHVLYGDDNGREAWVYFDEVGGREILPRDVFRKVIEGDCSIQASGDELVIRSVDRNREPEFTWYAWRSGQHLAVYVQGIGFDPTALRQGFLAKFPSSLPQGLKFNKREWLCKEVDFWLSLMRQNLEAGDPDRLAKTHFQGCIYNLRQYVLLPPEVLGVRKEDTLEVKQKAYEFLSRWWEGNKDKSYWHKGYQKLAVKGYTPEELAEAEQKRQEAENKAKLDAELTEDDLKRITPAVVKKLEAWMQYLADLGNKTLGADSGCKFEKVGESEWHRYFRECKGCALYRQTITGPTLRKWRDRRFPLVAEFRCVDHNLDTGNDSEEKVVYHYRKLEDLWSEGPPPK